MRRRLSVQCVVASGCIRMALDILATERFRVICVGIVRTGFHIDGLEPPANSPSFSIIKDWKAWVYYYFYFCKS